MFKEAALDAAEQLFKNPFPFHPFNENDIQPISKYLNKSCSAQVKILKEYSDNCLLPDTPIKIKHINDEEFNSRYLSPISTHKGRASGGYSLCRLYHLTGDKKYIDGFIKIAEYAVKKLAELQDGDHPPSFAWHPNPGQTSGHDPGHVGEELLMALPLYRAVITTEQKLFFAKMFLKIADFNYRAVGKDSQFNIPMHLITTSHCISCVFPQFKKAATWKAWARHRIVSDYSSAFNTTSDGYFREGIGYQNVVHNLILKNLMFWKATGEKIPKSLLKISEKSFEFATKILRVDGTFPLMADTNPYGFHERHIVYQELLNVAAVFFNRPDFLNAVGSPYKEEPLEILHWDMGWAGIQKFNKMKKIPRQKRTQQPHDLSNSGYQVLGKGLFKNSHQGVLTYACNINHAHFDVGSIDIWGYGRPLITDPGFASYNTICLAVDTRDTSHNMTILSRVKPLGPRIEGTHHCTTTQVIHKNDIQCATFINKLYETHTIQRTICFIAPGKIDDIKEPIWVILDTVKRKIPWPGKDEPYELAETIFHLNAPDSELGIDKESQTIWSKHSGKNRTIKRYEGDDINFQRSFKEFDFQNYVKAIEGSDSDANIQISGISKKNDFDYIYGMRPGVSFTCQYGGRVKRPSVTFMYDGNLPYTSAYILIPFKGVRNKPFAKVAGEFVKNKITASVESVKFLTKINISNFNSTKPTISYTRKPNK